MRKLKALLAILSLLGIIIGCTEATTTEVITNDKKPEYKISFNANGGKGTMSDISIVAETSIILPENTFTRDNYTFMGWATTADGEVMFKNGAIFEGLYSDITLYAKWEKKVVPVVKITITFDVNEAGGTAPTAIETTLNKNVDLPVLTNAKFSHWNTKADGSGQSYKTTATFTESVTLYAILLAENAHTITYELDGGVNNTVNPFSFTEEDTVTLKNPTKDGYKFVGWYETADFSDSVVKGWFAGDKTANVTLYAKWEKEATSVVKITITFDVNGAGGTAPTAIETTPDENVELPVLTNAKFSHWNTSPDGSGQSYNGTATFTESVTLYAILLAENAHTITYELDGGVNHSKNPYSFTEDEMVALREPTKDGYKFVGWYENANFSGEKIELWYEGDKTANVTLYAKWEKVYTITFDANGGSGEMNKQEFIVGEEQKLNENTFTCDGNGFVKWNTKPDGSGINYINGESYSFSENVTLYAQWIRIGEVSSLKDGYLRINFTGTTTPMGVWIWGGFDESEISKCTVWGDKAFPLTGKNGDFFAFDIKLIENPKPVGFIILTDGWKKLSGDADITFKFPQKYKEIWVDTNGKIWIDAAQTKEPAGLLSASITSENEITMVTTGIDSVVATDFTVTDKNGNPINVTNATATKLTIDNTDYINKAPYTVIYTDKDKNKDTVVANIRSSLFLENDNTFNGGDLIIPDGTISIDSRAFSGCESLTSVTIPDSVTSIGYNAFSGCSNLESVSIGNSVMSIGNYAFYNCSSLASVTIPDSVTSIGYEAFDGCSSLESVTIGNSVTSIDSYAFRDCSSLTSVHITDLTAWNNIEFYNSYSNPLYYGANLYLNGNLAEFTVTFDAAGGVWNGEAVQTVTFGEKVAEPTEPSKTGYVFYGWYTSAKTLSSTAYNFDTVIKKDITLYAKWVDETVGYIAYSDGSISADYDSTKTPVGIVIEATDGTATKIVSLTQTYAQWSTEEVVTNATSTTDGMANMTAIQSISGWEEKYPAFKWCDDYTDGADNSEWYLPAMDELEQLYSVKDTVNAAIEKITAGGGTATKLGTGNYWSSSQSSNHDAWYQRFSDGFQDYSYKVYTYSVRAVRAF